MKHRLEENHCAYCFGDAPGCWPVNLNLHHLTLNNLCFLLYPHSYCFPECLQSDINSKKLLLIFQAHVRKQTGCMHRVMCRI